MAGNAQWLSRQAEINSCTAAGKLLATDKLAMTISSHPSDMKSEAERTLLGQVELCKGDETKRAWRKTLAERLLTYNFQTWEWLSHNIYTLPPPKKSEVSKEPEGRSRDIRLKTDSDLQRKGEHLEDFDSEMLNLNEEEEEVMDVDGFQAAERLISQSPRKDRYSTPPMEPRKPVSPVKPMSPVKPRVERSKHRSGSSTYRKDACRDDHPGSQPRSESRSSRKDHHREDSSRPKPRSEPTSTHQKRHDYRRNSSPPRRGKSNYHHSQGKPRYQDSRDYKQPRDYHQGEQFQPRRDNENRRRDHSETQESRGKKPRISYKCPVSNCCNNMELKHTFQKHVPLLFHPYITGKEVAARRRTALVYLQRMLVGTHKTLQDLVGMAKSVETHKEWGESSPQLQQGMKEFMEEMEDPTPGEFNMDTSGIWTLLHWKRLLSLVSLLKPGDQIQFQELFEPSPEEKEQLPHTPTAFDSHCHLDRCMNKLDVTTYSLADINSSVSVREDYQVDVRNAVGVFCDPETYPTRDQMREWKRQGVIVAVGLHPRKTRPSPEQWQKFEELQTWPEVTAFGEVGLDRTEPVSTWSTQMLNLDRALLSLRPDQVIILHGRSADEDPDEAWLSILFILKACSKVTRDHLIHCHCFMGSKKLVQRWIGEFPNTYFGFTSIVSRFHQDTTKLDCIRWLNDNRLLLETDAPYFPRGGHRRSVPALLGYTADEVAKIRGVTWQDLLKTTNYNATRLYLDGLAPATEPK